MAINTPNEGYYMPDEGNESWYSDLDTFLNAVDTSVTEVRAAIITADEWTRVGNVISPKIATDGLSIAAVGEDIGLGTDGKITLSANSAVDGVQIISALGPFSVSAYSGNRSLLADVSGWTIDNGDGTPIRLGNGGTANVLINPTTAIYADAPTINIGTQAATTGNIGIGNPGANNLVIATGGSSSYSAANLTITSDNIDVSAAYHYIVVGPSHTIDNNTTYSAVFGANHNISWSPYSLVYGTSQTAISASHTLIAGRNHVIDAANYSVICGDDHDITNNYGTAVFGLRQDVQNNYYALVFGGNNQVLNYSSYSVVGGQYNELDTSENTAVFGSYNVLTSSVFSLVSGNQNNLSGTNYSFVTGLGNTVSSGDGAYIMGNGNTYSGGNFSLMLGFSHNTIGNGCMVSGSGNTGEAGADYNIIGGSNNTVIAGSTNNLVVGYNNELNGAPQNSIIGGSDGLYNQGSSHVLAMGKKHMTEYGPNNIFMVGEGHRTHGSNTNFLGYRNNASPFNKGTSITIYKSGSNVTITDTEGYMSPFMVGNPIELGGATNAGNNGAFIVTAATYNSVTFVNASGATEGPTADKIWRLNNWSGGQYTTTIGKYNTVVNSSMEGGLVVGQYNFTSNGGGRSSVVIGEYNTLVENGFNSFVSGTYAAGGHHNSMHVHSGGHPNGMSSYPTPGQGQLLDRIPHSCETTDGVAEVLHMDGNRASVEFELNRFPNHAFTFVTYLVAKSVTNGGVKSWKFETTLNDIGGAHSIVGTPTKTVLAETSPAAGGEASWDADPIINGHNFTFLVQGSAGETIRWQAYSMGPELGIN